MDLNEKVIELENRVKALELHNKRVLTFKIITSVITVIFVIIVALVYLYILSKTFNTIKLG